MTLQVNASGSSYLICMNLECVLFISQTSQIRTDIIVKGCVRPSNSSVPSEEGGVTIIRSSRTLRYAATATLSVAIESITASLVANAFYIRFYTPYRFSSYSIYLTFLTLISRFHIHYIQIRKGMNFKAKG